MTDRRRLNAPPGGTSAPLYTSSSLPKPTRTRPANTPRSTFLQTGLVPSASGSSYLEISSPTPGSSNLKLTCTVHGPRPLPRNTPFSSTLVLNTHVKYAPFASHTRRGYVRDATERDLGAHLETALRGVVIGERWPKSAAEVIITVLEGEEDGEEGGGWGMLNVLAGCITAASAAIVDAGIDCVDLVSGGVAAVVEEGETVLDPAPSEHRGLKAGCVVGYLMSRDEVTEVWMKGQGAGSEGLIDKAVEAAVLARSVLAEAVKEAAELKYRAAGQLAGGHADGGVKGGDVDMKG